ncbi:MAG: EamA family transporter [Alphaproteobacteria bacterium]|nr:EamA family transporter [Alphaproteobacteria bacterium]
MPLHLFFIVIFAAFLHASWNVLVKSNLDRFLAMFMLQSLMGLMGIVMLAFFAFPGQASLPYALTSGLLHTGYNLFLVRSYKSGELGLVYPVARGTAPLLTLIGTHIFTQDALSSLATAGIVILILGIWLIAISPTLAKKLDRTTLVYALITSVFIGLYTVVDGLGGRASNSASGYTALVFILDATFMVATGLILRGPAIFASVAPYWRSGVVGALASGSAYWIVIYAMSVAPIAMVAALREISILFAIGMSARLLREPLTWQRLAGGVLVVVGAMALRG